MDKGNIYISVINDLVTDQRVQRIARTLVNSGHQPVLIGRKFKKSPEFRMNDIASKRFRLIFNKGFLFYACYNIRLFFYLLSRRRISLLVSNDLDTLPANFLVSRIRRKKLVYDSHEYFTEVPELIGREGVKKFWTKLEKFLVPKVDLAYTVNDTLAKLYSAKYGIHFDVVRNVPEKVSGITEYELPENIQSKKIILYQGAVNRDRGLEEMIDIIGDIPDTVLVIAGSGDVIDVLKRKSKSGGYEDRIFFAGRLCPLKLKSLTERADLGISLEKKTNLNYYYALPNKIFDYIQAGVPLVCSSFPEMKRIIDDYGVGTTVDLGDRAKLVAAIRDAIENEDARKEWKSNCKKAAGILNWENEQNMIICIYTKAGLIFEENQES